MPIVSGGGAAGVSGGTVIQTGHASPVGVVVPRSVGAVYQDLTNGALYLATGVLVTSWHALGGDSDTTTDGIVTLGGIKITADTVAGGAVVLQDTLGAAGTGNAASWSSNGADGAQTFRLFLGSAGQFTHTWGTNGTYDLPAAAAAATNAPRLSQLSPKFTITSGALPTVQLVTATGTQISTGGDVETITPCTFNPGATTTATVTVALSPDNVTYSTLAVVTEPAGVALDGTILPVKVRVPAGWYLKLTVNAQAVLGLTTYY